MPTTFGEVAAAAAGGGSNELADNVGATKLLLHWDEADGSTTPVDSASGHTVTANGNVQVKAASALLGAGGSLFDGTGDYWSVADHADWDLPQEFAIGIRIKPTTLVGGMALIGQTVDANNQWLLFMRGGVPGAVGFFWNIGGVVHQILGAHEAIVAGDWNDVVVARDSDDILKIWVNGRFHAADTFADLSTFAAALHIGHDANGGSPDFSGSMDELILRHDDPTTPAFDPRTSAWLPA